MAHRPLPIVALDVPHAAGAFALLDRLGPRADFVKVGLQLFVAEGPSIVRALRDGGRRVFLDLKLHDIPNTVARAAESAAAIGVDLLTLHASGGPAMMRAARAAIGTDDGPRLLAVTVLTSLSGPELATAWGRGLLTTETEAERLAAMAAQAGMDGVVASVHEAPGIRRRCGGALRVLTPGIRLAGDALGDQTRVATPAQAARAGVDYVVLGRSVTAAADPALALGRVLAELEGATAEAVR